MSKQVVHYSEVMKHPWHHYGEGGRALVTPVDHPSHLVVNGQPATTAVILAWDEVTGIFETSNTVYIPT